LSGSDSRPNTPGVRGSHRFGTSKLERFGIEDDLLGDVAPPEKETVRGWVNRLAELGLPIINGTQDT